MDIQSSWELLDVGLVNSMKDLKDENLLLRKEVLELQNVLQENRKLYMEAMSETNLILKENRKVYNETLKETTEILNENREIYLDAVNKVFKLEKEINELRPIVDNINASNNKIIKSISEPSLIGTITSRIANREWRQVMNASKSSQIPYQVNKSMPFSMASMFKDN